MSYFYLCVTDKDAQHSKYTASVWNAVFLISYLCCYIRASLTILITNKKAFRPKTIHPPAFQLFMKVRMEGPCVIRSKFNRLEQVWGELTRTGSLYGEGRGEALGPRGGPHVTCDWPMASWVIVTWGLPVNRMADRHGWKHYFPTTSNILSTMEC